jgi:hypothetical protein
MRSGKRDGGMNTAQSRMHNKLPILKCSAAQLYFFIAAIHIAAIFNLQLLFVW